MGIYRDDIALLCQSGGEALLRLVAEGAFPFPVALVFAIYIVYISQHDDQFGTRAHAREYPLAPKG